MCAVVEENRCDDAGVDAGAAATAAADQEVLRSCPLAAWVVVMNRSSAEGN
jgi:hypothetical protein